MTPTTKGTDKYRDKAADKSAIRAISRSKPGARQSGSARSSGRREEELLVTQISCAVFCRPFNMLTLSPYDDRWVTGRRHRAEGASQEEQQVRDKNKNSAIVRVCQLRMIVWLVDSPLVSSAGHPHPDRGRWPQPRNSAASTLRSSCTNTLKVRHAAPSCMTSSPTRRRANSLRTCGGAKRCVGPVPSSTSSGASAKTASR